MDGNTKSWARSKHKQSERQKKRHGKGAQRGGRGGRGGAAGATGAPGSQHPPPNEHYEEGSEDESGEESDEVEANTKPAAKAGAQTTTATGGAAVGTAPSENKGRSKYSRRKITSNHDRYQDVESDEEEESRGADMRTLLAQASSTGAGAHMILKGDAELEAESVSAFEVDCAKLAASLRSLPLALRLDLKESIYLPELAALEAAGLRTEAPEPIAASVPLPRAAVSSPSVPATKHTPLAAPIASASPSSATAPPTPAPVGKSTVPAVVPKPAQPTKKEAQDLAELDDLLAASKPAPSPAKSAATPAAPAPAPAVAKPAAPKGASGKDLEDWLDSVI